MLRMAARRIPQQQEDKSHGALKRRISATRLKRPALVSLHPNSRLSGPMGRITRTKSDLAYVESVPTGQKRKRTASATTTTSSLKRRKRHTPGAEADSESSQDIDESSQGDSAHGPESKDHEAEDDDCKLPIHIFWHPLMPSLSLQPTSFCSIMPQNGSCRSYVARTLFDFMD